MIQYSWTQYSPAGYDAVQLDIIQYSEAISAGCGEAAEVRRFGAGASGPPYLTFLSCLSFLSCLPAIPASGISCCIRNSLTCSISGISGISNLTWPTPSNLTGAQLLYIVHAVLHLILARLLHHGPLSTVPASPAHLHLSCHLSYPALHHPAHALAHITWLLRISVNAIAITMAAKPLKADLIAKRLAEHGRHIFAYHHIWTGQTVYSLERVMNVRLALVHRSLSALAS